MHLMWMCDAENAVELIRSFWCSKWFRQAKRASLAKKCRTAGQQRNASRNYRSNSRAHAKFAAFRANLDEDGLLADLKTTNENPAINRGDFCLFASFKRMIID